MNDNNKVDNLKELLFAEGLQQVLLSKLDNQQAKLFKYIHSSK